jgi:hypothetical protein
MMHLLGTSEDAEPAHYRLGRRGSTCYSIRSSELHLHLQEQEPCNMSCIVSSFCQGAGSAHT